MRSVEALIRATRDEASRREFPIDLPVYEKAGRDPLEPVLYAGSLGARVAIMGRDLGKDEVAAGQPLIGAGGRLVRRGVYRQVRGEDPPPSDRAMESVLGHVLLTNTVPYKPPGNKAYSEAVKERFRPLVAELLASHWAGSTILTLGTEAFQWYSPYAEPGAFDDFWRREDRYEAELRCELVVETERACLTKSVTLGPLPHPSPLNRRWYPHFPKLLAQRLARLTAE